MDRMKCRCFALAFWCAASVAVADVSLPPIFSDHMVLERAESVPIWGLASPGERVKVSLPGKTLSAVAGESGRWSVVFDLKDVVAGPFEVTVQGMNEIRIADVVVGEVWLASGQSNMEWSLSNTIGAAAEVSSSENPMLRQFTVAKNPSNEPTTELKGVWSKAGPETSGRFSAVGYFFGKELQKALGVPVGIIHSSWGGTPSEAWTSGDAISRNESLRARAAQLRAEFDGYPERCRAFASKMSAWLKATGRTDPATGDRLAAPPAGADGWIPVTLPGTPSPSPGVVWLRKEIPVPVEDAGKPLAVDLGKIVGYETVFWNGKEIGSRDFATSPSIDVPRQFTIPADLVQAGSSVLDVRVFSPLKPAQFSALPKVGRLEIGDSWQVKPEVEFAALDAAEAPDSGDPPASPPKAQNIPSSLFNGMIHPLLPYAIRGVIWYQGEANAGRAWAYREAFPMLITDWRSQWKRDDLPFLFCQLANYMAKEQQPGESAWAELREAQTATLKLPNTGQAVLIDIGESGDIHPRNKKDAGERLARIALAGEYDRKIVSSGPVYESMKIEGDKIRIHFHPSPSKLIARPLPTTFVVKSVTNETAPLVPNSPGSELEGFAICGADRKWTWAQAKIDGDAVVVWSPDVPAPIAVRYAWSNNPNVNLYNADGLPAGPFRTDDFPASTKDAKL